VLPKIESELSEFLRISFDYHCNDFGQYLATIILPYSTRFTNSQQSMQFAKGEF